MASDFDRLVALLREARLALSPSRFLDLALDFHKRFKAKNEVDEELVIIDMMATISTSTANSTANSAKYTVPANSGLFIQELHGIVAFNDPDAETLNITGIGNPEVIGRTLLKAMNCRVTLRDLDAPRDIMPDRTEVPLAPFVASIGGRPIILPPNGPEFIPPGHNLQLTAKLKDTAGAIVGGETQYGFLLVGKQVRLPGER